MAVPDLTQYDSPLGPLRDKFTETIGTDDYILHDGFICQVGSDGDVTYRTLHGAADQTETLTSGDVVSVGNVPVVLRAVRGASTVTSIIVGRV